MSEPKLTGEDLSQWRLWHMRLLRDQAAEIMDQLHERMMLWPDEARRLDVFRLHHKMNQIAAENAEKVTA